MELDKKPIIVIGMHRSGTTLISQLLEDNDINFGISKESNNESHFFLKINEFLLSSMKKEWFEINGLNNIKNDNISFLLKNKLSVPLIFKNHLGSKKIKQWGWKDPRTTLFIEYYLNIFKQAKVIHMVRNPLDVALSLQKRQMKINKENSQKKRIRRLQNKIKYGYTIHASDLLLDLQYNFRLWNYYVSCASNVKNRLDIRYEDLLEDPKNIANKISSFIGRKISIDASKIVNQNNKEKYLNETLHCEIKKNISKSLLKEYNYFQTD